MKIAYDKEALEELKRGVNTIADTVKVTLGPSGQNVAYRRNGRYEATKDGVTVANHINLSDAGAQLVKDAATRTGDNAGDATTTSCVLAQAIFLEGLKAREEGVGIRGLKAGIEKAVEAVVASLKKQAIPVETDEMIQAVATLSANSDPVIGKLVSDAIMKINRTGQVLIHESNSTEDRIEVHTGIIFGGGIASPFFATDKVEGSVDAENPLVLILDVKVNDFRQIQAIVETAAKQHRYLLIIGSEVEAEALNTLCVNHVRGSIKTGVVRVNVLGKDRDHLLEDLAVFTGAQIVSEGRGHNKEGILPTVLGSCGRFKANTMSTTLTHGTGKEMASHAKKLKEAGHTYRYNQFEGGIASIYVGGKTETEMKERKDRVDDAVHAAFGAIEEGVVPGGGNAYLRAQNGALANLTVNGDKDEQEGAKIVMKALAAPYDTILKNAGIEDAPTGKNRAIEIFDARTAQYVDPIASGIIDPVKAVRMALENAASVSVLLLTTGAVIGD